MLFAKCKSAGQVDNYHNEMSYLFSARSDHCSLEQHKVAGVSRYNRQAVARQAVIDAEIAFTGKMGKLLLGTERGLKDKKLVMGCI
jgi:hypothetical protein